MKYWAIFIFLVLPLIGCFFSDENNSTVLTDHPPAFSSETFAPQMIASPQAFFSASQPAKFVFDNGANFCGFTKDLETRCWPQNWLDTGYTWRYFNLEKILLLWDSTRVVALDHETFDVLYDSPRMPGVSWDGIERYYSNIQGVTTYASVVKYPSDEHMLRT